MPPSKIPNFGWTRSDLARWVLGRLSAGFSDPLPPPPKRGKEAAENQQNIYRNHIKFSPGAISNTVEGINYATTQWTISDEIVMTSGGPPGGHPLPGSVRLPTEIQRAGALRWSIPVVLEGVPGVLRGCPGGFVTLLEGQFSAGFGRKGIATGPDFGPLEISLRTHS